MDFLSHERLQPSNSRMSTLKTVASLVSGAMALIHATEVQAASAKDTVAINRVLQVVSQAKDATEAVRGVLDTIPSAFGWAYGSYGSAFSERRRPQRPGVGSRRVSVRI